MKLVLSRLDEAQGSIKTKPNSKFFEMEGFGDFSKAPELFCVALEMSLVLANSALMELRSPYLTVCIGVLTPEFKNGACWLCKVRGDKSTGVVWCHTRALHWILST